MGNESLGRLARVNLREIWSSESANFTPWLAREENLKLLGAAIGIDLELQAQEREVGPFRADILCRETNNQQTVVIENQIEGTDHSHLGQLLTYAAGLDAVIVVWIAQEFTEQHRAALDWLNERSNGAASFFGIEIEVWRIGDSAPAPKFNVVSKPNDWSNRVKQAAGQGALNETQQLRIDYWNALSSFLKSSGSPFRFKQALPRYWINVPSPMPGYRCGFEISARDQYIDAYFGSRSPERIAVLREIRKTFGTVLEQEMGEKLEWTDTDTEGGSLWISVWREADPSNARDWPGQHEWLKNNIGRLIAAMSKRLNSVSPGP